MTQKTTFAFSFALFALVLAPIPVMADGQSDGPNVTYTGPNTGCPLSPDSVFTACWQAQAAAKTIAENAGLDAAQAAAPKLSDKQAILAAQKAVKETLKDPDSAKFSSLVRTKNAKITGKPLDIVCGFINAKNSFGGYAGASLFAYVVATKTVNIAQPIDTITEGDFEAAEAAIKANDYCQPIKTGAK